MGTLMRRVPCVSGVRGRPLSCSAGLRRPFPTHPVCGTNLALTGPIRARIDRLVCVSRGLDHIWTSAGDRAIKQLPATAT